MEGFASVRLDQVQAAVRENPITSVLVSIGAGVGLGWLCQAAWRDYRFRLQLQQFKDNFETESVAASTPRSAAATPRESLDGLGSPPGGNMKMVIAVRTDLGLVRFLLSSVIYIKMHMKQAHAEQGTGRVAVYCSR